MAELYIGFVDTPGLFASMIRGVIRQKYIHVVVGLDDRLEEAYSFGRRNPAVPLIAGFEKENKYKIWQVFPNADYMVCSVSCTDEQKDYIKEKLEEAYRERSHYHYAVLGLPFILCKRPFYQKNHYTCSSYIGKLFEEAGIHAWGKHFSLVTPKDFFEWDGKKVIFEGKLQELLDEPGFLPAFRSGIILR
ncbi:MAG: hypothetical protein HDQ95_04770 [Roseburia sp.]|nr:hypothetical protein [Roseburia sp.]